MGLPKLPGRTTPGFAFSVLDRALKDCLAKRAFGPSEVRQVLAYFGEGVECAFCGSPEVKRWDHLVPVTKGGETVMGNMVLACATCDDSKRDLPYDEWMQGGTGNSLKRRGVTDIPDRIQRLHDYVEHFGYTPSSPESRLDPSELEALNQVRADIAQLRVDMDSLIARFRSRTREIAPVKELPQPRGRGSLPKATTCIFDGSEIGIEEALELRDEFLAGRLRERPDFRCGHCNEPVRAHKAGGVMGAHFEHLTGNPSCPMSDSHKR